MKEGTIITISRQYGSGGRIIGEKLAGSLGIPFYDKELITLAAKSSGFEEHIFEDADKQAVNSLLYSLSMGMYTTAGQLDGFNNLPLNDKVFLIQYNVIRDLATKGPCVIVGRCADYVLKDNPNALHVFIHAELSQRVCRGIEEYGFPPEKAESMILKNDKRRAAYYEYYSGLKWARVENFDLTLDSGRVGLDGAAAVIREYALHSQSAAAR